MGLLLKGSRKDISSGPQAPYGTGTLTRLHDFAERSGSDCIWCMPREVFIYLASLCGKYAKVYLTSYMPARGV